MSIRGTTLRDVATLAGVSVGTASKAFNNKGSLHADTRRRVLDAASQLHFAPNALIRSLQRGTTNTLGVLTWEVRTATSRDISMPLLIGISREIAATGRDMLTYSRLPERTKAHMAATFMDGRTDGLILGPEVVDRACLTALAQAAMPVVVVYDPTVPEGVGYVDIENASGVVAAVAHLAALGHTRIAFWAPYRTFNYTDREAGYRQGLKACDIPFDPNLSLYSLREGARDGEREISRDFDRLLTLESRPTALVFGDDNAAFQGIAELEARGLRVPKDMSVVGFDDSLAANYVPGLTTVRQSAEAVGQQAVRFVDALLRGVPASECRTVLPVELVVRGTTAPPWKAS